MPKIPRRLISPRNGSKMSNRSCVNVIVVLGGSEHCLGFDDASSGLQMRSWSKWRIWGRLPVGSGRVGSADRWCVAPSRGEPPLVRPRPKELQQPSPASSKSPSVAGDSPARGALDEETGLGSAKTEQGSVPLTRWGIHHLSREWIK